MVMSSVSCKIKWNPLDKLESLEKLKSDDKVATFLAKLINIMLDLSNLAQKHNLEGKLYIGGGIEKVFSLLGNTMERKFHSKHLDDDTSSSSSSSAGPASEVSQEKQVWENLIKFLQKELSLREKMILVNKSKLSLGITLKPPPKDRLNGS